MIIIKKILTKSKGAFFMYIADKDRYNKLEYARCGKSGLKLPRVSLGLWHNLGDNNDFETMQNFVSLLLIMV